MLISIIIRTLNEDRHLEELLQSISIQEINDCEVEVIIVDSGSTDQTLEIATSHNAKIRHILKENFTFGRSLNYGCDFASGDYLVFISGHCVPTDSNWLANLLEPIVCNEAVYVYGRQIGNSDSKFSECQLFKKLYPEDAISNQGNVFCNNANSAIRRDIWAEFRFNENLTGLEDLELAARVQNAGMKVSYVCNASVYHLHYESFSKIKNRFERESLALQHIMPQIHVSFFDFLRYFLSSVFLDFRVACQERRLIDEIGQILGFRFMQFWGSYLGNNEHRKLSQKMKEKYFYPR